MIQRLSFNMSRSWGTVLSVMAFLGTVPLGALAGTSPEFPPSVNENYVKSVLPILKQSCFACHGPQPQSLDRIQDAALKKKVKKVIDSAQAMLQMEDQFPFSGDDNPKQDLKDMAKALKKGWMPPEEQKKFNLGTPLSETDKKILLNWVEKSRDVVAQK
jgi:hypothetical protein